MRSSSARPSSSHGNRSERVTPSSSGCGIEALFHDTPVHRSGPPQQPGGDSQRGAAALELYAVAGSGDSWAQGPLPSSLSDRERAEIADGCYTLLLVMAEAEPTPDAGLRRLDQAARSRPPTRAYHLRRAACLARAGNVAAATQERAPRGSGSTDDGVRPFPGRAGGLQAAGLDRGASAFRQGDSTSTRPVLGPRLVGPVLVAAQVGPCRRRPA